MAMQFDKSSCRWSILGTAADVHRSNERAAILRALEAAGDDGLSVAEIMAATESQNRNATDILLFKMTETGEVSRVKRGVYARNLSDLSDPPSSGKIGKKERYDSQGIENIIENSNLSNLSDLSAPGKIERKNAPTAPVNDPWEGLDIPDYLNRTRARLGSPAISAGPDDDLGDLQ